MSLASSAKNDVPAAVQPRDIHHKLEGHLVILDHLVQYRQMRTKSFDPEGAKKRALEAFWQHGYEGTNLPELLEMMRLGRASFYNAFGSKHELFIETLDLYLETLTAHFESLLAAEDNAESALVSLVDGILAIAKPTDDLWRGCFIGNTALELGAAAPKVAERLNIGIASVRSLLERALSLPLRPSRLLSEDSRRLRALQCTASLQGLLVLAKSGLPAVELQAMRDALINTALQSPDASTRAGRGKGK